MPARQTDRLEKLESNAQNEPLQKKSAELHTFQGVAARREHLQANILGIYFLYDLNKPVKSDYPNHVSDLTTTTCTGGKLAGEAQGVDRRRMAMRPTKRGEEELIPFGRQAPEQTPARSLRLKASLRPILKSPSVAP